MELQLNTSLDMEIRAREWSVAVSNGNKSWLDTEGPLSIG
jgi:hypothetical protein